MIIKTMPVPAVDAGRKSAAASANAQNNDPFAATLKKQIASEHKPQAQQHEQPGKASLEAKKKPAEEKARHDDTESDEPLTQPQPDPLTQPQTAPLIQLVDSSQPPATLDSLLNDLPAQQTAPQEILPAPGIEGMTPDVTTPPENIALLGDSPLPTSDTAPGKDTATLSVNDAALAAASSALQSSQTRSVLPHTLNMQTPAERATLQGNDLKVHAGSAKESQALTPASAEAVKEGAGKAASFSDNIATALHNLNSAEPQNATHSTPQNATHSTPEIAASAPTILPASLATAAPTQAVPTPGMATGTLQADVGTPAWQQSLGQQIAVFTRNGIHHAELRLHPEDLGALQVNLKINNDQAQVHFVAESHHVRAALESALPHLRTMLAESGIQLGQSSVGADTASSSGAAFSGEFSGQRNSGHEGAEQTVSAEEERNLQPVVVKYSSGINTFV